MNRPQPAVATCLQEAAAQLQEQLGDPAAVCLLSVPEEGKVSMAAAFSPAVVKQGLQVDMACSMTAPVWLPCQRRQHGHTHGTLHFSRRSFHKHGPCGMLLSEVMQVPELIACAAGRKIPGPHCQAVRWGGWGSPQPCASRRSGCQQAARGPGQGQGSAARTAVISLQLSTLLTALLMDCNCTPKVKLSIVLRQSPVPDNLCKTELTAEV